MSDNYECKLEVDENGEYLVTLPEPILCKLGINKYSVLSVVFVEGEIQIRQKTDWTIDQLQEGDTLDMVLEDIQHNGTIHHILDKGKTFLMTPYSEELTEALENYKKGLPDVEFTTE